MNQEARKGQTARPVPERVVRDQKGYQPGEPVAIIGMACRFPGANDLEAFWRELMAGEDAITEGVPGSGIGRVGVIFPSTAVQREACRFGGYLDEIDHFDAEFFRISPKEAQFLDPQQRLMLETSWRALEDAGIDPDRLRGSRTGVYAGISNNEYRTLVLESGETSEPAASLYSVSGNSFNTAIGRVAFTMDLRGPAIAVDTACSSSLVAIHQAVTGLQAGEADLALAGGVHTILSGRLLELRANAGMLAPDGRCKTFDASANGYVRGEGCGIVVLKRLKDAEADGDQIWGVILGSAINQDGASPGLTVPNGEAQERVIEDALGRAGVIPAEVDYLEAHGTGTPVGDPIELNAAAAAYGHGREEGSPLVIGSVKTNIGHLEAAAGVAGVIKTVLAIKHGVIPKNLHFHNPTPAIDWENTPIRVPAEKMEWPPHAGRPQRAGVSGFGWSGTNAHVVLEGYGAPKATDGANGDLVRPTGPELAIAAPTVEPSATEGLEERKTRFLPLSGRSQETLKELAGRYVSWMEEREEIHSATEGALDKELADITWTASVGRSHFSHRAGLVFRDSESLRSGLKNLADAEDRPEPRVGSKIAFVFTGQGSQWIDMGKALYESEPVAREILDRCDRALQEERGVSLLDVMFGRAGTDGDLDDPAWTQPAIYALECALTALWGSVGIRPSVVAGHSLGEIAAAQAAGVFTLEQGLRFASTRGTLMGGLPPGGAMAAVFASPARVASVVAEHSASYENSMVSVAVDNGAHQVLSGPATEVDTLLERLEGEDILVRKLRPSPAYHSALVEPILDGLEAAVGNIAGTPPPPSVVFVSDITGQPLSEGETLDGAYWRRHARQPVAFRSCVETLAELGVDAVIEIGPHAILGPIVSLSWPGSASRSPVSLSSLMRPRENEEPADSTCGFVTAVARAYEAGLDIDFTGLFAGEERRRVSLPGYPFQRQRHWVEGPKRSRPAAGHALLGIRHESPRGEVMFETELFPSDPAWLNEHRVFGRVVVPGALYGAMAASASFMDRAGSVTVEDLQLHNPLLLPEDDSSNGATEGGRRVQLVMDNASGSASRNFEIYSKGGSEEAWTLHAEGRVSPAVVANDRSAPMALDRLRGAMPSQDVPAFYRARAGANIELGTPFRTLSRVWAAGGEAVGEVVLPESQDLGGLVLHPLLLDGCFQVMSAARYSEGTETESTYIPFAWERLWLTGPLPERVVCHAVMRNASAGAPTQTTSSASPEVLTGDLRLYAEDGTALGGLDGLTVKRATRASLLSAEEGLKDLLYEVVWRDSHLAGGMQPADFLRDPDSVQSQLHSFPKYLLDEGVESGDRSDLLNDLERLSWSYALHALERLGWERKAGEVVDPEVVRQRLNVLDEHRRLFRRLFELLARAGVVTESGDGFTVALGPGDPMPEILPSDPDAFANEMAAKYAHGLTEIGLFRRSGSALSDALIGSADPLTLLFSSGEPTAADLYLKAPVARAANHMLGDAIAALLSELPEGRRLRVIEVGAGVGSATASVLPELPEGRYDYMYTDISAGFFAEAERQFGGSEASIEYRVLDIEVDPIEQGFEAHSYDLVIASNVLHATRYLDETLANCRELLAPSGQLVALENLRGQGWLDLTFGQLDGWWRFADSYRPNHALASPAIWKQALSDTGYGEIEVLGVGGPNDQTEPDRGVIVARGPVEVKEPPGVWLLVGDQGVVAEELAEELAGRNQTVVVAGQDARQIGALDSSEAGVVRAVVETGNRDSWRDILGSLSPDLPLKGVVHLAALDGHGMQATTGELADDAKGGLGSALALVQGMAEADAAPEYGVWFVTRGAQVLEWEGFGEPAGALLWGFGKVVAREAAHLQPRMIDLHPGQDVPVGVLANELMYPDAETHIAYRYGLRQAARLVKAGAGTERLTLPEDSSWTLEPDPQGVLEGMTVEPMQDRSLEPKEVRVALEAAGLSFWDVFRSIGLIEEGLLGGEMIGRVVETGPEVSSVSVGDRVAVLTFGTFRSEAIVREEMLTIAPAGIPSTALATIPTVFVSAAMSYDFSGLEPGERVLIHAGAGGVGLAAIQLAQAAGAEVFATASAPKQAYLRSLGVKHVFDSRQTRFGEEILEATGGEGVHVVLNSLTGEGFIDASLSCLAQGGRFVELSRVGILSNEEMAEARPDVAYHILELDRVKEFHPEQSRDSLKGVMDRLATGELTPLVHSRWALSEAVTALKFMRAARHIGKIVFAASPIETGRLREDGTYLVTGGLGGIGCEVARWLADRGAGVIVLNGRRAPDPSAEEAISELRERGVHVHVELADVTDPSAVDAMLERIDENLPPLAGVIHSVGVLSDAALTNQTWESFEQVMWPKVLGAWQLHRATADRELDMFILFSSVAGVMGNAGQANHAAANAFLDQLAAHRRSIGLPGQSIAWGAWSGLGEAEEQRERIERQLAASGTGWIPPQQGIKALDWLVRQDWTAGMVAAVDWEVFNESQEEHPPLLEELIFTAADSESDSSESQDDLLSSIRGAAASDRDQMLVSFLQKEIQAVMRMASAPSASAVFSDLGMDSLMAVELRNRLNRAFAGEYVASNTIVFDYPNIGDMARFLAQELGEAGATPVVQESGAMETRPRTQTENDGIAIVGLGCRFPGSEGVWEFWRQLKGEENVISDGRRDAGPWDGVAGDPNEEDPIYRRGAFLEGIDKFDSRFFRIAPIEARTIDPQQRLLLETTWQALEDAGIDPEALKGSRTGVYAGVSGSEYRRLISASGGDDSYFGTSGGVAAGRISFTLGLRGPAVPVELACASSVVAIHQAVVGLQQGEIDMALAGGVNVVLSPPVLRFLADTGLLSKSGQCWTFDAAADGFVRGEGCGMVVLKRLSDAEADGDRIWGVIRGTAVNQNGAGLGLTLPNGPAQEMVMEEALSRAGVTPAEIDYIEAHGPGSAVGDSVELNALASVYGRGRAKENPLLIGSVKTNIGHLEAAGGIASLIKVLLAMNQGVIPKHLNFHNPNPEISWERMPLKVTAEATAWPDAAERPRLAAVNVFGITGSNAHMVVEEYGAHSAVNGAAFGPVGAAQPAAHSLPEADEALSSAENPTASAARLLPLSGKSDKARHELAERYLSWLDERDGALSGDGEALADMAWTAGVGRSHFPHRAGLVFRDIPQLQHKLRALVDAGETSEDPEAGREAVVAFVYSGQEGQWKDTAKALYENEPVARAILDRCSEALQEERGVSLMDVLLGRAGPGADADDPALAQAAAFAVQCAIAALWESAGIRPDVVSGRGLGEVVAAQSARAFSLEDGLRLAAARGAFVAARAGNGSAEPLLDELKGCIARANVAQPTTALVSSATGRLVDSADAINDESWLAQVLDPVVSSSWVHTLANMGVNVVVGIGSADALESLVAGSWPAPADGSAATEAPTLLEGLTRTAGEEAIPASSEAFVEAIGKAYEAGLSVSFEGLFAGETRRRVSLPGYPFQRRRHWI